MDSVDLVNPLDQPRAHADGNSQAARQQRQFSKIVKYVQLSKPQTPVVPKVAPPTADNHGSKHHKVKNLPFLKTFRLNVPRHATCTVTFVDTS